MGNRGFWLVLLTGLLVPAGYAQDSDTLRLVRDFAAAGNPDGADRIRSQIREAKSASMNDAWTGLLHVMAIVQGDGRKQGAKHLKALNKYFAKAGGAVLTNHKQALAAAVGVKGRVGTIMALAHVNALLQEGQDPAAVMKMAKKIKLQRVAGSKLATVEGNLIRQISRITSGEEALKLTGRAKSPEVNYMACFKLMKDMTNNYGNAQIVARSIKSLAKWWPEHVAEVSKVLSTFKKCQSCSGTKSVVCAACMGQGKRELICTQCDGKGKISKEQLGGSHSERGRKEGQGAVVRLPDGSTVSVGPNETVCPTCIFMARKQVIDCAFCETKRTVQCQRCLYFTATIETIGDVKKCDPCGGSGLMFPNAVHPCQFCKGPGEHLIPSTDGEALVGPLK